jgi:hypothetical protein
MGEIHELDRVLYNINGHFRNRFIGGTYHIYKANIRAMQCKGISPQNMALYGTVPPFFRILKFPLIICLNSNG